jgi:hypothetical protein
MILRQASPGEFSVVGFCFVHGLMDGESFLGPLPDPWKLRLLSRNGSFVPEYVNPLTDKQQSEDPRLPPLADGWKMLQRERTQDDPEFFQDFRNEQTGRVLNSDPRLLPEALAERAVPLETFRLI